MGLTETQQNDLIRLAGGTPVSHGPTINPDVSTWNPETQAQADARMASTAPTGPAVNSAALNMYNSQLAALSQQLANLLASNSDQYNSVMGGYQSEFDNASQQHAQAVTQNEQNQNNSRQAAELAAAQGARGLRATLAAIGGLGGTGDVLANRMVAQSANADIGNANDTFDSNATSLQNTWDTTQTANDRRKADAAAQLQNANTKSRGDVAAQGQDIYSKMAGLYGTANDTGNANTMVARGMAYQPDITAASRSVAPTYDRSRLSFSPGELAKYLGGQNDMSVNVAGGDSGLPAGQIYTNTKKRDLEIA